MKVKQLLGLDYAFANQVISPLIGCEPRKQMRVVDNVLTGETVGSIIDGARKAELLQVIAQAEGVGLNQVKTMLLVNLTALLTKSGHCYWRWC